MPFYLVRDRYNTPLVRSRSANHVPPWDLCRADPVHSTVYAPFSPLMLAGQHSTLHLKARDGIVIEGAMGATADDCTGIAAGVLGLYNGKMSLCVANKWTPIKPDTYTNHVPTPAAVAPMNPL